MSFGSYDQPGGVYHPSYQKGKRLWFAPEIQEVTERLRFGAPDLGWEGDARFAIYLCDDGRWEVQHINAMGERYVVCRSKPGAKLDDRLIIEIRNKVHRMNKGINELDAVNIHNEKRYRELQEQARLEAREAVKEARFYARRGR